MRKKDRGVVLHQGRRKVDQTVYYALKFTGGHRDFILTPSQFRTVMIMSPSAEEILKDMPRGEPRKDTK